MKKAKDLILILDFGSQYTQLIARRVREMKVFSLIKACDITAAEVKKINPKGIILSGGPHSVYEDKAPVLDKDILDLGIPLLGICYGMQIMVRTLGGKVAESKKREYGKAGMYIDKTDSLFFSLPPQIISWMSHTDQVVKPPRDFVCLAHTPDTAFAALGSSQKKIYGVQFHPEVVHTQYGLQVLSNFLFRICECFSTWQLEDFIQSQCKDLKAKVGKKSVICGLSGGVDSSTLAVLIHKAIGSKLKCIYVDTGMMRKGESKNVVKLFRENFKIDLNHVDASKLFLSKLKGVTDPEQKRKIIGHTFIDIFEAEAKKVKNADFLAQGTLYPDVIESIPLFGGPTAKIKSHHNVGGLPEKMNLKLIEPFKNLFKDEVREIARLLAMPEVFIGRHPFPGPGLAVRIVGEITRERLRILRDADAILEKIIRKRGLYDQIWQSFCVLLPLRTVGVMGDRRTYDYVVAVRAVTSLDGMTADWFKIPHDVLEEISNNIINRVKGINRVVLDISTKPPATIEWE